MQIYLFRFLIGSLIVISFSINVKAQDFPGKGQIGSMLPIDDNTAVGHVVYGSLNEAFLVVDQKGQLLWSEHVRGYIKGEGKWNGNVIFFYTEKSNGGPLHATIVDLKEKKISKDKIIYDIPKDGNISVENDSRYNFSSLLFRSNRSEPLINMITLSADLEIYTKMLMPADSRTFIDIHTSKQGDIFLTSMVNSKLIAEKFDKEGEVKSKLQVDIDVRNKSYFTAVSRLDTFANNTLVAIQYVNTDKDKAISLYRFDFDAEKVKTAPPVLLDKVYAGTLEEKEPDAKKRLKSIDEMVPVDILTTHDKVILVKEIRTLYSTPNAVAALNNAAVVSVFNKELKPLHETVLNKYYQAYASFNSHLVSFIYNEKLYVLCEESEGLATFYDYCYIIDLSANKKEKKKLPQTGGLIDAASTVWFKNSCILGYLDKEFGGMKGKTKLKAMTYEEIDKLVNVER
ncbi:hypothetical protein A3860_10930 [Niastella vici]|uniref:Uncharacterized protein n=1 Tax=Niastella vici TaxID=1703345 RepID=A0A1V9FFE1_9BACT|nr:hypothetical protein [Niastella vici]OQP57073.1 hypothetical protein A3860_10930 [Niastella vici]